MAHNDSKKTAFVTGSARRVGKTIAAGLVDAGYEVLLHSRSASDAEKTASEIGAAGWVTADLSRHDEVLTLARDVQEFFSAQQGLDLLVNSASSFEHVNHWCEVTLDSWERAMNVIARAPFFLTCELLPLLRTARGCVINVSDHAAHQHWTTFPVHSAAKAALESLTYSAAKAFADDEVRVCAISPGTILAPDSWSEERVSLERRAGKLGTLGELVAMITDISSDAQRSGEVVVLKG